MPTYLSPGVYVDEVDSGSRPIEGVGTAVAAFVGLAEQGPFNAPTLVSNWTQFSSSFGGFVVGSYLAQSVYAYFQNGGGNAYVVRIGQEPSTGGSRARRVELAGPQAVSGGYRFVALDAGTPEGQLTVDVVGVEGDAPEGTFKVVVRQGEQVLEEFDRLNTGRGRQNLATAINANSKLIKVEEAASGAALTAPPIGASVALTAPPPPAAVPSSRLSSEDYVGDVSERTGFSGLEAIDEITMVCVPDLMSAYQQGAIDLETVQSVQLAMIAPLRTDGRSDGHPRPTAGPQCPAGQGMAGRQSRLRLEVRHPVLAVGQGDGSGLAVEHLHAAVRVRGRHLGAERRHPGRPQGTGQRGRSGEQSRSRSRSPRTNTTCSTRSVSTACARFPAAASASGVREPSRRIRPGDTSTCAACSTTSRSRSWPAPTGWCSSRTTMHCGPRSVGPCRRSW